MSVIGLSRSSPARLSAGAADGPAGLFKMLLEQRGRLASLNPSAATRSLQRSAAATSKPPTWVPPRGDMKVTRHGQTFLVSWVRGKRRPDGWSVTGHFVPFVNGKARPAGRMVLSSGSKIRADGRLDVRVRLFDNSATVSRLTVFQTSTGKWYKRFHSLYTKLRQDASHPEAFRKVGSRRILATKASADLADFIRDYGAAKIAGGGDGLSAWLRKHIFALTKSRLYGKAPRAVQLAGAVQLAARAAGLETVSQKGLFESIVLAVRREEKHGFRQLRRYAYATDPKTGIRTRKLINTGYTKATLRLAAHLAEIGRFTLVRMQRTSDGAAMFQALNTLLQLKRLGGFVSKALNVVGLALHRRKLQPGQAQQAEWMNLARGSAEADDAITNNFNNGIEIAVYNNWARTGNRILTHQQAQRAADAWRDNFRQNLPSVVEQVYQFLRQPGALRPRGEGMMPANPRLRDAIIRYLTLPSGGRDWNAARVELQGIAWFRGFTGMGAGRPTLPQIINTLVFGAADRATIEAARAAFVVNLDETRRRNTEAAVVVARAAPVGSYWDMLRILLGFGLFTVQNGKYRGP